MDLLSRSETSSAVSVANRCLPEWEETVGRVRALKPGEGAKLYAEDYGYKIGEEAYAAFPSKDDVARLRSMLYARGVLINAYRTVEDDGTTRFILLKIASYREDRG